jgi:ribosomal protein L20
VALDRKSLAELAMNDPAAFGKVVEAARAKVA